MKKFRLSIFSFDTVHLGRNRGLYALVGAVLVFAVVEGAVRILLTAPTTGWDYWTETAASKYITYARLREQHKVPAVLTVGDSSADYGFSPVDFSEALGKEGYAFNLATLGNFPLSFDQTINKIVLGTSGPQPEYLFIIFTRGGFEQRDQLRITERSVIQSPVVKKSKGFVTVGHLFVLGRVWQARVSLLDHIRYDAPPISFERGFQARDDDIYTSIEKPSMRREFLLDPDRLAVLERTFSLCRRMNIQPVLIHPPIHSWEKYRWVNPDAYVQAARQISEQYQVPFWDYSHVTLYDDYMRDLVHLDREGARFFSIELAERFQQWTQR